MTDWDGYLACDQCPALQGEACFARSSGGPEALPEVRRETPHTGRPRVGEKARKPRAASARTGTASPVRRAAKRTATKAASWQAVADRQRAARETR